MYLNEGIYLFKKVYAIYLCEMRVYFLRQVLDEEFARMKLCQQSYWSDRKRDVVASLLLFVASLLLALVVPNIGSIISLLGGSASLFIFIYPGELF